MSIVGPRPEDPLFVALHPDHYDAIHSMRPGITGITQLAFAQESSILDAEDPIGDYVGRILPNKVQLDLLYAKKTRLWLDVKVIFWTIAAVLLHRSVAVNRSTARMNTRRRPRAPRLEAVDGSGRPVHTARLPRVLFRRAEVRTSCSWRAPWKDRARVARRGRAER
jgi:hypothetical protein